MVRGWVIVTRTPAGVPATSPRPPAEPLERYPVAGSQFDAFGFEQPLLDGHVRRVGAGTHAPLCVDYAMPGNGRVGRQGVERVRHLPRVSLKASQSRDLAVGGHAPAGNSLYHGVDTAPVSAGAHSTRRAAADPPPAPSLLPVPRRLPLTTHRRPTNPLMASASFAGSYPRPFLKTVVTFRISAVWATGLPRRTTRSACFPGTTVPTRSATPRIFAPFALMIWIACSGVKPASTRSS